MLLDTYNHLVPSRTTLHATLKVFLVTQLIVRELKLSVLHSNLYLETPLHWTLQPPIHMKSHFSSTRRGDLDGSGIHRYMLRAPVKC